MSELKATSMAFEKRFSDDSGVEMSVRLVNDYAGFDNIEFYSVGGTATFPLNQLDWLILALARIDAERSKLSIADAIRAASEERP